MRKCHYILFNITLLHSIKLVKLEVIIILIQERVIPYFCAQFTQRVDEFD